MAFISRPKLIGLGIAVGILFSPLQSFGGSVTTADIVSRSLSVDCLEWKISGICIWLKCTILGCFVVTTPRISHRLPDFVVSAYPQTMQSPWTEIRSILAAFSTPSKELLSGGSIVGVGTDRLQQDSLHFNEVDVIGSPAANFTKLGKFLCRSQTKPFFPYFVSVADAIAWRSGLPDVLEHESTTPGVREIGRWPHFTWGNVYPRGGFVIQNHPGKAAAVSCQRGIDVVLRDGSGHVVKPLSKTRKNRVARGDRAAKSQHECNLSGGRWAFNPKFDNVGQCVKQVWHQWLPNSNEKIDRWQMLLPSHSSKCETFGESETWRHDAIADDGKYVWNYWAKYKCCVKAGGILLSHFDF